MVHASHIRGIENSGDKFGEIRERFGLFQGADRRPVLFDRLIEFLKEARESAMTGLQTV
jgi:hypothetical protein